SPSLSIFFIILPPPPTSTLFPYTTLFRSIHVARGDCVGHFVNPQGARGEGLWIELDSHGVLRRAVHVDLRHAVYRGQVLCDEGLDRKSTRLNSSHVSISYAVFCLKKKNII